MSTTFRHRIVASATRTALNTTLLAAKVVAWTAYWSVLMPCIIAVVLTRRTDDEET